jgi:Flp pilus assembly pilin Flp
MKSLSLKARQLVRKVRELPASVDGSVVVEYMLLLTIVGIGIICGLAAVRTALINELLDMARGISAMR